MNELVTNGAEAFEAVEANRGPGTRRLLVLMAVLGASLAVATFVGISLFGGFSGRLEAQEGTDAAIQAERARTIRMGCEEQNARNKGTKDKLDEIIAGLPEGPRKTRAVQNKPGTVLLIDALAPVRNCDKLVRESVVEERGRK